ncbi:hypothetical protein QQS21_006110 [Conoideocrella luteorostrata]|uniref:TPR-like protein n=1 Tax=Conoideocrella luteorostrata TaxID=1105319 RepID=A0AAJ0CSD8_9HYPO|nr:hypothetical protein QQS21_006110 [Conoideocrella luteorostrata]
MDDLEAALLDAQAPKIHINHVIIQLEPVFENTGKDDVERAIRVAQENRERDPNDHENLAWYLNDLGQELGQRSTMSGQVADLEAAILLLREAVNMTPENNDNRMGRLNNLGLALRLKHEKSGDMAALEAAISFAQEAVNATPEHHQNRPMYLRNLSAHLGNKYRKSLMDRAGHLLNLGIILGDKYMSTANTAALEDAFKVAQQAVDAAPEGHPGRPGCLGNLACQLNHKHRATGDTAYLNQAILVEQELIDLLPENYPDRAVYLGNLGSSLLRRYKSIRAIADLEDAIWYAREAITVLPSTNRLEQAKYLNHLGTRLCDLFKRTGEKSDLEEAIQATRDAIRITPKDHLSRAAYHTILGYQLRDKFTITGAIGDLDEAIEALKTSIQMTPDENHVQVANFHNLGLQFGDRYRASGKTADLTMAIQFIEKSVEMGPRDDPYRAVYLISLGIQLQYRCKMALERDDLIKSISSFQTALDQPNALVQYRALAGMYLMHAYAALPDWEKAYSTACMAVHLASRSTARSLEAPDKQYILAQNAGLGSDAAAMALHAGRVPLDALDLLEEGRGVLATSLEDMRVDIVDLRSSHPSLAEQFSRLRARLDQPLARSYISTVANQTIQSSQRYQDGKDMDAVIEEIRKNKGFERFLRAPSEGDMRRAAGDGPIVVINVSKHRCDAILVEEKEIQLLPLPDLLSQEIEERARQGSLDRPKVLEWLWDAIASPVLMALKLEQPCSGDDWPHILVDPDGASDKVSATCGRLS